MARPLRLQYPGAVYHLTSRGSARQKIFWDDTDRETFLQTLGQVISRYGWLCHAYCLMDNHYHLLVETPKPNLARGMRQLNGIYTQAFNRCHGRVGHLFQGRYKAILVEKQAHLLELCRYVVLNPVRARPHKRVGAWPWSSYRATAGLAPGPAFLTVDWVLGQFGQRRRRAQDANRDGTHEAGSSWVTSMAPTRVLTRAGRTVSISHWEREHPEDGDVVSGCGASAIAACRGWRRAQR